MALPITKKIWNLLPKAVLGGVQLVGTTAAGVLEAIKSTGGVLHFTFGQTTYDSQTNADVDQTLEEIATFNVTSINTLLIETIVTLQALDMYSVKGQISGGSVEIIADVAALFTAPPDNGVILQAHKITTATGADAADNDLTTTAAGESAILKLDVTGYDTISIDAACAADNGNTLTHGSAQ